MFFFDLLGTYKAWRHTKGLPSRGQRTWTNAWTSYNNNTLLRYFRIFFFKNSLNLESSSQINLAEQINLLWKIQWEHEWKQAKKKQSVNKSNNINSNFNFKKLNVDFYAMSQNEVYGYVTKNENLKKKNSKKTKNQFSLGFDIGFTKFLNQK